MENTVTKDFNSLKSILMILLDRDGVIDADGIVKFCSKIGITPDVYIFI